MRVIHRIVLLALVCLAAGPIGGYAADPGEVGSYNRGGRNVEALSYAHEPEFPPYRDRAAFLGELRGSWREMGRQFGEGTGESILYVSDIWWKELCENYGREETLKAFDLYLDQIAALEPGLIDFMRGIAEGGRASLDRSPYADPKHPYHATAEQRVIAVNLYDEWAMMHPMRFPDGASTYGGSKKAPRRLCLAGCSAFAAKGSATSSGEVISAHNRHSPFSPRCYEQAYVLVPEDGYPVWVLTNAPQVAANQVVNNRGVSLSLLAGGTTTSRSLDYRGEAYCAEGFGVPWFHLFLYAAAHASTAREAIDILTVGTEEYRARTGRRTLLRGGGWNFLVADKNTLAVVEATANRYAVRYSGDETSFTGPGWTDPDFIVATNHFICEFSYDEKSRRTDVPMTIFQEGFQRDPSTGEITGLNNSGVRFWTLMWDIREHYGRLDRYRAQQILAGAYARDKESGEKIEVVEYEPGMWSIYGQKKGCTVGILADWGGTCDAKIALIDGPRVATWWTMGSPVDWQGAWDEYLFSQSPKRSGGR